MPYTNGPAAELRGLVLDVAEEALKSGEEAGRLYARVLVQSSHEAVKGRDCGPQHVYLNPDLYENHPPKKGDLVHYVGVFDAKTSYGRTELTFKAVKVLEEVSAF